MTRLVKSSIQINKGAKIISSRFSADYKGAKRNLCSIHDLIHYSSNHLIDEVLKPNHEHDNVDKRIAILQNIESEDESEDKQMDISSLIVQDKLIYHQMEVFNGNWKSGNCYILVLTSMMGLLVKNKFMSSKSALMLSSLENFLSEFEQMFEGYFTNRNISRNDWNNALCTTNRLVGDLQNLVAMFKFAANDVEKKEEMFSLEEVLGTVTENMTIATQSNESNFELQLEQGIPDLVYGDMTKFRQITNILMNFANWECAKDKSTLVYLRLVDIDAKRRYNVEMKISIPKSGKIDVGPLNEAFTNTKLDLNFFIKFKDFLHKYDFGMLICSYLVSQ